MKKGSVIVVVVTVVVIAVIAWWVYKNALEKSEDVEVNFGVK